jgi:toluene monooxygenase system protein E
MPSEYEIVTHKQNWTLRTNRAAAFEQNPSSAPNLWFLTYRDNSPLQAEDWDGFRDPDALTCKAYVSLQSDAEAKVQGALQAHAEAGSDAKLPAGSVALLGHLLTPSRYLCHGFQQIEAYVGYMAPSSYITNAASFSSADFLRRVTTIGYRTGELQIAWPDSGIGSAERSLWEGHASWQAARKAVEYGLASYDWGEAFTALNLVLAPTLDDVLLTRSARSPRTTATTSPGYSPRSWPRIRSGAAGGAAGWPSSRLPSDRETARSGSASSRSPVQLLAARQGYRRAGPG